MEENCPECGNEIYKPYKYCNACGWEKEEEKRTTEGKTDRTQSEKESKKEIKEKPKKPFKIKCKCGETIIIKSSKRPIKIECPSCGRKGTIKAPVKTEENDPEIPTKSVRSKQSKERVDGRPQKRRPRDFDREISRQSEPGPEEKTEAYQEGDRSGGF